ncbi:beta-fructofuranosidase, insoluble isoenzyme 1 [Silene latifolia]|uniref:beta-fructofuranosidase, insoluble isoenzyme 1 n=1 Tax=Silene latifolia TaxID=37657 RepID=UPI003D77499F
MFYKGWYHLFYQYNPWGSTWGNIIWAHSVSKDLINWVALEPALHESSSFDINGVWSGSATVLPDYGPVLLYTGVSTQQDQVQNLAYPADPSDPLLRKWVKPEFNPIINPSSDMNVTYFRDPTTAWSTGDGHWKIIVGGKRKLRGMAHLYRSKDFKKWIKAKHPLHSAPDTGMWECPDFYPVPIKGKHGLDTSILGSNVKHVLKVSLDITRYDYYTIGHYDPIEDKYTPINGSVDGWEGLRYDYGNFYASKSFYDPHKNRRILWGWANESCDPQQSVTNGWAGVQAIPRTIWLDPSGKQLLEWPVEELNTLRGNKVELSKLHLETGKHVEIKGITAAQADVEVTFHIPSLDKAERFDPRWTNPQDLCTQKGSTVKGGVGPFGLLTLASDNLEEYTPVFFRIFKDQSNKHVVLLCSDATSSSLGKNLYKPSFAGFVNVDLADKKLSLRSLIDHSVIESFGEGGKTCILSRVYPSLAVNEKAHLHVFNNGTQAITVDHIDAWSMNKPLRMNN